MDIDVHQQALDVLCRICKGRNRKYPVSKKRHGLDKRDHVQNIKDTYKIDITKDDRTVHPKYLCLSCVADFSISRPSARPVQTWEPHSAINCLTCQWFINSAKGGRPKKPAKVGAARRQERELQRREEESSRREAEKRKETVDAACQTVMEAAALEITPTKKLRQVATSIIRSIMQESGSDTIELPTGGPVSQSWKSKYM